MHFQNGTTPENKNSKINMETVRKAYDQIYEH